MIVQYYDLDGQKLTRKMLVNLVYNHCLFNDINPTNVYPLRYYCEKHAFALAKKLGYNVTSYTVNE